MSLQDISLPVDIPWKLVATSYDMIANHQKRFPHAMWKSSMAIFSYDPDPTTDLPEELALQHRALTYLKVVCSITSYVPPCEDCPPPPTPVTTIEDYGEDQANHAAWEAQCKLVSEAEHKPYACSGALVQVAIYPRDTNDETYDPKQLAYFAAFEPKKRELIEVGTESGESITQSKNDTNVRKGTTSTSSNDNYDVLTGVNTSAGFAGASASVGVSGEWGTVKKSGSENVNVTNSDASRDLREGASHTTNISNLYHLLNSYHLGTNRAIFFVQPRPHTLQQKDQFTFIDGPQDIEGIQEFFLIVNRPDDKTLDDYCLDGLLYTAHLDDDASAKALNDPKTAETNWIEFSAIAPKMDDGGHSVWDIAADLKGVENYVVEQIENTANIWGGNADPSKTPADRRAPAMIDGYITPSFITKPYSNQYNKLLDPGDFDLEYIEELFAQDSNAGWRIDRNRGIGGYDLWEDPNNSSGFATKSDDVTQIPPEGFVDIISLNAPDDTDNYLPDYGLRVRAQVWPTTKQTTMYRGRIKAYFIRNDMATNQRTIDMFITVRGVSTCSDSPFFNYAPDKAILIVPDVAADSVINPRNVSPWKATEPPDSKPHFATIQDPNDQNKQILLSTPKGNSVPSGLDHQVLGAARAKMANMIGQQVVGKMNSALSCLAERTDGTLIPKVTRYGFRETDLFFNRIAGKMMNTELAKLSTNVAKDPAFTAMLVNHSRVSDMQQRLPALSLVAQQYQKHVALAADKADGKTVPKAKAKAKTKKATTALRTSGHYPVLTLNSPKLNPKYKSALKDAGMHTAFDLLGRSSRDLSRTLDLDEATVRRMRLQLLGLKSNANS